MIEVVKKREEGKLFPAMLFLSRQEKVKKYIVIMAEYK